LEVETAQSPIADSEIASQRLLPTTMGIASQKPLAMTLG